MGGKFSHVDEKPDFGFPDFWVSILGKLQIFGSQF